MLLHEKNAPEAFRMTALRKGPEPFPGAALRLARTPQIIL
jgi:hypothetical protein